MGAIFASAEVTMVAFCGQHGEQSLTGPVLACLALGSAVAGLWYGGRTWRRSLLDRFRHPGPDLRACCPGCSWPR